MVDFNSDIPKGKPKLDPEYWKNFNNSNNEGVQNSPLFKFNELNTDSALKDMKNNNSIFNDTKK